MTHPALLRRKGSHWGAVADPDGRQVLDLWQALLDRARRELQRQEELVSLGKDGGKEPGKEELDATKNQPGETTNKRML